MNIFAAGISCNKFIRLIRLYTLGMTEKNILFLFHEFRGKTFDVYVNEAQFVKRKTLPQLKNICFYFSHR